jgi:hypothetical protein
MVGISCGDCKSATPILLEQLSTMWNRTWGHGGGGVAAFMHKHRTSRCLGSIEDKSGRGKVGGCGYIIAVSILPITPHHSFW